MKGGAPLIGLLLCLACTPQKEAKIPENAADVLPPPDTLAVLDTEKVPLPEPPRPDYASLPDSAFVELIRWDSTFVIEVRYATTNNFMKKAVYPCAKVLLRKKAAEALIAAHEDAKRQGYRLKIFDGYRPRSVQWDLWHATDKKQYVANPKYGSNHNRGAAVDLTLVNARTLAPLAMGTDYDYFGKKAHHSYAHLPDSIRKNRSRLKQIMIRHGFSPINSEWWHYNFKEAFPLADRPLPCSE